MQRTATGVGIAAGTGQVPYGDAIAKTTKNTHKVHSNKAECPAQKARPTIATDDHRYTHGAIKTGNSRQNGTVVNGTLIDVPLQFTPHTTVPNLLTAEKSAKNVSGSKLEKSASKADATPIHSEFL